MDGMSEDLKKLTFMTFSELLVLFYEQNEEKVRLRTIALHRWKVLNKQRQIPKKSTIKVNPPYLPTS